MALNDARKSREAYLALYDAHPTTTFRAMAQAHTALKDALNDPSTQFDAMKAAMKEFEAKASAAYKAVEEARESE